MSANTVDERIVSMQFDNSDFEKNVKTSMSTLDKFKRKLKFDDAADSFNDLERSSNKVKFEGLSSAMDSVEMKISAKTIIIAETLRKIVSSVEDSAAKMIKSLSFDQMTTGFSKYEQQVAAVQTMMAAVKEKSSGESFINDEDKMEYVNTQLEKLLWFTDETSYNFTAMASTIGKFVSNGVDLEKAANAMQGIATWAAISGQNAQTATNAMTQLAQALGSGKIRLQDWQSIETANMATSEVKQQFLDMAVAQGKLVKVGDKYYKTNQNAEDALNGVNSNLKTYTNGMEGAADATQKFDEKYAITVDNFRSSLAQDWFDTDVLTSVLEEYGNFATKVQEIQAMGKNNGKYKTTSEWVGIVNEFANNKDNLEEQSKIVKNVADLLGTTEEEAYKYLSEMSAMDLGRRAFAAAQEAKTFSEVIDSIKEASATRWMNIWQSIFGNYLEAKKLWTAMANDLYDVFVAPMESVETVFSNLRENGLFEKLFNTDDEDEIYSVYEALRDTYNLLFGWDDDSAFVKALTNILGVDGIEGIEEKLYNFISGLIDKAQSFAESLVPSDATVTAFQHVMESIFAGFSILKTTIGYIKTALAPIKELFQEIFTRLFVGSNQSESLLVKFDKFLKNSETAENIVNAIAYGLNKVKDFILKIIDKVTGFKKDIKEISFSDLAIQIKRFAAIKKIEIFDKIKGFFESIGNSSFVSKTKELFGYISTKAVDFFKGLPKIELLELFKSIVNSIFASLEFGVNLLNKLIPVITKLFNSLTKGFNKLTTGLKGGKLEAIFNSVRDTLQTFADSISGKEGSGILDVLLSIVDFIGKPIKLLGKGIKFVMDILGKFFDLIIEKLSDPSLAERVFDRLKEFFDDFNDKTLPRIRTNLVEFLAILQLLIPEITLIIAAMGSVSIGNGLRNIGRAIKEFSWDFRDFLGLRTRGVAKQIRSIALLIGVIAAAIGGLMYAIFKFSEYLQSNPDAFTNVLKTIGLFALILVAASGIVAGILLLVKAASSITDSEKVFKSLAGLMISMSVVIATMIGAMWVLDQLESVWTDLGVLAILVAGLTLFMGMMATIASKYGENLKNVNSVLTTFSINMLILAGVLAIISKIPNAIQSALILGGLIVVIGLILSLAAVIGKLSDGKSLQGVSSAFLSLSVLLITLAGVMQWISNANINWDAVTKFGICLGVLIAGLALLSIISTPVAITAAALTALGMAIVLMGVGMLLGAEAMKIFSESAEDAINAILNSLVTFMNWFNENIGLVNDFLNTMVLAGLDLIGSFIHGFLKMLADDAPLILKDILDLIMGILKVLNEHAVDLAAEGTRLALCLIIGILDGISENAGPLMESLVEFIISIIEGLAKAIGDNSDRIVDAIWFLIESIIRLIFSAVGIRGEVWEAIKSCLDKVKPAEIMKTLQDAFIAAVKKMFELMFKAQTLWNEKVKPALTSLWDYVKSLPGKWVEDFKQFGKNIIQGLIDGFENMKKKVKEGISNVGDTIANTFKGIFGIHSPSKVFQEYGEYMDEGLVIGLGRYADQAADAAGGVGYSVMDAMSEAISEAANLVENGIDAEPRIRPIMDLSNIQNGVNAMGGMLSGNYSVGASANYANAASSTGRFGYNSESGATTNNTNETINNTFNITGDNPREIADEVSKIIQQQVGRRNSVWA